VWTRKLNGQMPVLLSLCHPPEGKILALTDTNLPETAQTPATEPTPALLPITTLSEMFGWYRVNLCGKEISDPRGYRVTFLDTDFVHLIKLLDKYGKEPKNRRMTIEQIKSGRVTLVASRIDIQRAQELTWARSIVEKPTMIVPNWQVMGKANPGDAYIKNFGAEGRTVYRVLICGHAGKKKVGSNHLSTRAICRSRNRHCTLALKRGGRSRRPALTQLCPGFGFSRHKQESANSYIYDAPSTAKLQEQNPASSPARNSSLNHSVSAS
jgi:hypothetical protein